MFFSYTGVFGNGVSSYFRFLRWLFLLNVTIFLLIMAFLVVPQVALSEISHHDNPSHLASNSSMNVTRAPAENDTMACSTKYTVNVDLSFVQVCLDFVQGTVSIRNLTWGFMVIYGKPLLHLF